MTYPNPDPDTATGHVRPFAIPDDDPTRATLARAMGTPPRPGRRRPLLIATAAALLAATLGAVGTYALLVRRDAPSVKATAVASVARTTQADPNGRAACALVKQWYDAGGDYAAISESLVKSIHESSLLATNADIVYRGNSLYDASSSVRIQYQLGQLNVYEVALRLASPMIQFETACIQAGYVDMRR